MKDFLIRLFVLIPAILGLSLLCFTCIIPILYWLITGQRFFDWCMYTYNSLKSKVFPDDMDLR